MVGSLALAQPAFALSAPSYLLPFISAAQILMSKITGGRLNILPETCSIHAGDRRGHNCPFDDAHQQQPRVPDTRMLV
jgi:hypothetical protein